MEMKGNKSILIITALALLICISLFLVYIIESRGTRATEIDRYQKLPGFYCAGGKPSVIENVSMEFCFDSCLPSSCECFDYKVINRETGSSSCRIFTVGDSVKRTDDDVSAFKRIYSIPSMIVVSLQVFDDVLAKTSDDFRMTGVNFDFWPSSKSRWKKSGALEIDLNNKQLLTLTQGLSGSLLRMGGSPADMLLYDTYPSACSAENLNKTQKHSSGYYCPIWDQAPGQCLTIKRWKELNLFAAKTGLRIAFDFNACWGRQSATGEMDFTMIEGLIRETSLGKEDWSRVFAFEFGNELYSNVKAERYASDMKHIKKLLETYWRDEGTSMPKLVGPDCGAGYLSNHYLDSILSGADGNKTIHSVTVHQYGENGNCRRNLVVPGFVLNVTCMDSLISGVMRTYKKTTDKHGVALWNGEGALQGSSGKSGLTNVFTSSFWYINTLASFAEAGIGLFSRQTLMGGDYELIDKNTFKPNPDYWVLLLWRKLTGDSALKSDWLMCGTECKKCLRAYSRSSLKRRKLSIVINFCVGQPFSINITRNGNGGSTENSRRNSHPIANYVNIYQLTGSPSSRTIKLNDKELLYDGDDHLPDLDPYIFPASCQVELPPASITFIDF